MKQQYKILENRSELTKEQILGGMDFKRIKSNVNLKRTTKIKFLLIKTGTIALALFSIIILYFNNNTFFNSERKSVLVDSTKISLSNEEDISDLNSLENIKPEIKPIKHRTTSIRSKESSSLPIDSVKEFTSKTEVNDNVHTPVISKTPSSNYSQNWDMPDIEELGLSLGQIDLKEINKSLAKITERLYASKFEVSNKLYMSFLRSLKDVRNEKLLSVALIDTLRWTDKLTYNEPYVRYYHSHPAYDNYPVVNISYEGAKLFCEWLTIQCNADPKRKFKKVIFRLPSEEEWMIAAKGGDSLALYPWEGKEVRNKKGYMMGNFKREDGDTLGVAGNLNEQADVTAPVNSYWKNKFGLLNMSGNVAEMVEEKGIAKGGSWFHNSEHLKVNSKIKYDGKAQPFVGFRYFAEILVE